MPNFNHTNSFAMQIIKRSFIKLNGYNQRLEFIGGDKSFLFTYVLFIKSLDKLQGFKLGSIPTILRVARFAALN